MRQAVNECISEDVLADFFREHKEEIVEMGIYEFDQELYDQVLLENGEAIGMEKGIEIGTSRGIEIGIKMALNIYSKIQQGETDNKIIAESCNCTVEEVEKVREQLKK